MLHILYFNLIIFDVQRYMVLLLFGRENDLKIYKFNHESNKSIITRGHICAPVRYKCCVCILQKCNTRHFKSLIPQTIYKNFTVR